MNNIEEYTEKIFEDIKYIDEFGNEFWAARELQNVLENMIYEVKVKQVMLDTDVFVTK